MEMPETVEICRHEEIFLSIVSDRHNNCLHAKGENCGLDNQPCATVRYVREDEVNNKISEAIREHDYDRGLHESFHN